MVIVNFLFSEDCSKQGANKQLPTAKWKRDRRTRLPEYSRKSDPKIPEVFEQANSDTTGGSSGVRNGAASSPEVANGTSTVNRCSTDTPLDMSIRHRGQPPSYSQTINNPGYRSSYRPSVIQNPAVGAREDLPSGEFVY